MLRCGLEENNFKAVRELPKVKVEAAARIEPAIYSDNCVSLMSGERRITRTELENADTR